MKRDGTKDNAVLTAFGMAALRIYRSEGRECGNPFHTR